MSKNVGLISSMAKYHVKLPASCHLCWHLKLTAWKMHSKVLLGCLRLLLWFRASFPYISVLHQPWVPLPMAHVPPSASMFTEQSPLQSFNPNPPTSTKSPPFRTNTLAIETTRPAAVEWVKQAAGNKPALLHIFQCGILVEISQTIHLSWVCFQQRASQDGLQKSLPHHVFLRFQELQMLMIIKVPISDMTTVSPQELIYMAFPSWQKFKLDKNTSKKLVLLVGCWCIYSCTFTRKLLCYQ